jgi:integrase
VITDRLTARGKRVLVIDLLLTRRDGSKERFRRDAKIQTKGGAKAEEESLLRRWFETGSTKPAAPEAEREPETHLFRAALAHYRRHGLTQLKESTRRAFVGMFDGPRFERWLGVDVAKITRQAIKEWQAEIMASREGKGASKSLLRMHRAALLAVLRDVGPDPDGNPGLMLAALPTLPKLPKNLKHEREIKAPAEEQVVRILEAASPAVRLALCMGAWTGMRPCEVRALTKGQVDLTAGTVTIDRAQCFGVVSTTKSGRERTLPIDPRLTPMLKERLDQLCDDDALVCVDARGEAWKQHGLANALKSLKRKLGLNHAHLYGLRHYRGTALARVTDIKTISVILGHARIETTQRYMSADLERMRAATQALAGEADGS